MKGIGSSLRHRKLNNRREKEGEEDRKETWIGDKMKHERDTRESKYTKKQ